MAKKQSRRGSLTDPSRLSPLDPNGDGTIQVVIETPKGSRNKYAFDADLKIFQLKKVLPAGMAFPYDFGFIPSNLADDGDPVDVLVLMDEPAFPGCLLKCRVIGVIVALFVLFLTLLRLDYSDDTTFQKTARKRGLVH